MKSKAAVEDAAARLAKAGAKVRDARMPDAFLGLHIVARAAIGFYERAACMAFFWDHRREQLSPQMQRYIENGHNIPRDDYIAGLRQLDECRVLLASVFQDFDVLLVPCVPGEAPKGLAATGDPSMQAIWTALHTPSMTLPTQRGPNNLPVGIQLVAQRYDDDRLFACARWIWQKIGVPDMVGVKPAALTRGIDQADIYFLHQDSGRARGHRASVSILQRAGLPGVIEGAPDIQFAWSRNSAILAAFSVRAFAADSPPPTASRLLQRPEYAADHRL